MRNRLFSSAPKSAKKIRDSLVHGISKANIDILNQNYEWMIADMTIFLDEVCR